MPARSTPAWGDGTPCGRRRSGMRSTPTPARHRSTWPTLADAGRPAGAVDADGRRWTLEILAGRLNDRKPSKPVAS